MVSSDKVPHDSSTEQRFCEAVVTDNDGHQKPCGTTTNNLYQVSTSDGSYTYRWLCTEHSHRTEDPTEIQTDMISGLLSGIDDQDIDHDLAEGLKSGLEGGDAR